MNTSHRLWRWLAVTTIAFALLWTFPCLQCGPSMVGPHAFHVLADQRLTVVEAVGQDHRIWPVAGFGAGHTTGATGRAGGVHPADWLCSRAASSPIVR